MLDFSSPAVQTLPAERGFKELTGSDAVRAVYNFVRDEILFGYNRDDTLSAAAVLGDGYGQCNTKSTLLMALLRAVGVPCRLHGFTIDKRLQKGAQTGIVYRSAPKEIVHSWVEAFVKDTWFAMEGVILDRDYLAGVRRKFKDVSGAFCGYGIATPRFEAPCVDWNENDTYIQSEGIVRDFGLFDSPDDFFAAHRQKLSPLKKWLYVHYGRRQMNKNVQALREFKR